MNAHSSHLELPYGLLELDPTGVVLRYAPAFEQTPGLKAEAVLGRNFFTEVVPAVEVTECQTRFRLFMAQGQTTDRFTTSFLSEQGPVKVQIALARILEKSDRGTERIALVRLMPDEGSA